MICLHGMNNKTKIIIKKQNLLRVTPRKINTKLENNSTQNLNLKRILIEKRLKNLIHKNVLSLLVTYWV